MADKLKKIIFSLIALSVIASCSPPKSIKPVVLGGDKYDSARSIAVGKNMYAMAGMTNSLGLGGVDAYLITADKRGKMKYHTAYGGKNDDKAYAITTTAKGGFMIAGSTESYGAGKTDVYLIKTDRKGNYLSARVFGGPGSDEARSICRLEDGYMLAGSTDSFGSGGMDGYIIKTDAEGDCVWAKTYGGRGIDMFSAVIPGPDGAVLAAGRSNSAGLKLPEIYAVMIKNDGSMIWEKHYTVSLNGSANSAVCTMDGNFVIAAEAGSKDTISDILLLKINAGGGEMWRRTYGGMGIDVPSCIIEDAEGNLVISGLTESKGSGMSDAWIIKAGKDGTIIWDRVFGGRKDEYSGGIAGDSGGGYVFAGWTMSYGDRDYDIYLFKLDKDGNIK